MTTTLTAGAVDYTTDRHAALDLVNAGQIIALGAMLYRADGADLDLGVFAALLWMAGAGLIERRMSAPDEDPATAPASTVRLTVAGLQLLGWFRQAHGRHPDIPSAR
ncbi:hypothetical protein [Actinokineospora sp. HUAS TT18]|uniref:hypothetical protein n=1 Tax=Actinokineospora sp. HUAS TT18 TaxID=3447451 RepID=UPI003F523C84